MSLDSFSNTKLKISVIVPVYGGDKAFRACIDALDEAKPDPEEFIVVADGGLDRAFHPQEKLSVKLIETPSRGGPAKARNIGALASRGDILFFIDADVIIEPDSLQKVSNIFRTDSDLVAVFGSYDDNPAEQNFLSQYRNLLHHYVHQNGNEDASTFWGACGAIRRDIFLKLGGFNEELYQRPAIEDIELGYRLKQAGYKIRLCKELQVKHLKRWGILSVLKTDFFQRALPWTELILRDRQFINDLNLKTSNRISVTLTLALLGAMISAIFWSRSLLAVPAFVIPLVLLNLDLYQFYREKRGFWFTIKVIPWHWLYYLYSGLAFAISLIRYTFKKHKIIHFKIP
jgi:cellulose synthase/poly-beta-1,6-N-acetylglucosamine synthase-like glycosyltransferase